MLKTKSDKTFAHQLANYIRDSTQTQSFVNWYEIPVIQDAYRMVADEFIRSELPKLRMPKCRGQGIVMAGGGLKYFPSMWVGINRLRHMGCKLPIEVWYLGPLEMDVNMLRLLAPLGVTFRDALVERKAHPMRILNGWELKPYAIAYSAFKEVLFLDADSVPVVDPTFLFQQEEYLETGTIFWPDYPHWILQTKPYKVFDVEPPKNCTIPGDDFQWFGKAIDQSEGWDIPVESGQLVINKGKAWDSLMLTVFFCAHSDYYFRFVHGDKEAFHLAWRKLKQPYCMPQIWPQWDIHTALQYGFDGNILFAHRNNDKWSMGGNSPGHGLIPAEKECFNLMDQLRIQWNGQLWCNDKPSAEESKLIKSLEHKTFFYHRLGHDARLLEFLPDRKIGKGHQEHEISWSVFTVEGKPQLVISGRKSSTCFLTPASRGRWRGEWVIGEGMPVELTPVAADQ